MIVNEFDELEISPQFYSQDKSVVSYTILVCLEKIDGECWLSAVKPQQLDLLYMCAAGMEMLYKIPEWMIEPLFMASIATSSLPEASYSIGHTGQSSFEDERPQTVTLTY